jgi:hypothetical protein
MWRQGDFLRLLQCSSADRKLLIEAGIWLGFARISILIVPFRWITRIFALKVTQTSLASEFRPTDPPGARWDGPGPDIAERVSWALSATSRRTPWKSTCLVQALAGCRILQKRGIPGCLTLGVSARRGIREAHAWLRSGDYILTGAGEHDRFHVVAQFATAAARQAA